MTQSSENGSRVRFSGFVFDADACTLMRDTGEAIPLTHGEFALLRFLLAHPGRVMSRDRLLSAIGSRRLEPFDRSVDVLMGRLRRKIESDPKRPCLIVTVPGEGYRFDGLVAATAAVPTANGYGANPALEPPEGLPTPIPETPSMQNQSVRWVQWPYVLAVLCLTLVLALDIAGRYWAGPRPYDAQSVVVLPFGNLTGDATKDYLGRALASQVSAFLGAYPALRVIAASDPPSDLNADAAHAARVAGARFAVQGGVHRSGNLLRVTATLYDAADSEVVWSQVFDSTDGDAFGPNEDVARQIYDSLAGFRGAIRRSEERVAWNKSNFKLDEYDYYLRGHSILLHSTPADVLKARTTYRQGLDRYPASSLLRIELARTYLWMAMNRVDRDPRPNIEQAWRLASDALSAPSHSNLEGWLSHWLMAFLYEWHDEDFPRSVAEARMTVALAPYDASSRNDLSWVLANAGYGDEAIAWARIGLDHDPISSSRYRANLAWAYYVAGRDSEAVEVLRENSAEYPVLFAALHARLGQVETARTLISDYLKSGGDDVIEREDMFPIVEPTETEFLNVLRKTGLPESDSP
jgi:TolB-like protein/DNA-binding winged helix-turn-helix (wHTH) protein